jgi:hypothetical protein
MVAVIDLQLPRFQNRGGGGQWRHWTDITLWHWENGPLLKQMVALSVSTALLKRDNSCLKHQSGQSDGTCAASHTTAHLYICK